MADLIKKIKIKKQDGTFTDYIPIGAEAQNVSTSDGDSVQLKLNKKPYYYNSIADMKADTKLKVGDMAVTLGYYEPNDGGNGEYRIISGTYTDDGGRYHLLNNNLFAELIIKEKINVKQYGAYGDNTHDDTTAIQNAIDTGKNIYVPEGNYLINETLNVINRSYWELNCSTKSTITYSGSGYAFLFKKITFSKLIFGKITASNGGCISFIGSTGGDSCHYTSIDFIEFNASTNCIYAESTGTCWINEMRINRGRFASGENGVYILHNSKNGMSRWVFTEIGIEGVNIGFNLNTGSYALENNRWISDFEFYSCRHGEAKNVFKTTGKIQRIIWVSACYVPISAFNITEDFIEGKFIAGDRTTYVYNGVVNERMINKLSEVVAGDGFKISNMSRVDITDGLAVVNMSISAETETQILSHNRILATGLPKAIGDTFVIGINKGYPNEEQPRLYVNGNGELKSAWSTANVHTGDNGTLINLAYRIKSLY